MDLATQTFQSQGLRPVVVESPTGSEEIDMGFAFFEITIEEIRAVLQGSASQTVTWNIHFSTDRDDGTPTKVFTADQVTTSTTGSTISSFDNATIAAGNYIWFVTTAQGGTVQSIAVHSLISGLR
jgi:hypothetical protein